MYVDGKSMGTTTSASSAVVSEPLRIDLLARGSHRVQLVRPGYYHPARRVDVEVGQVVNLHETMIRRFIPDTMVRIGLRPEDVRTGVMIRKSPNGDVELETSPGILLKIESEKIYSIEPLKPQNLP